MGSDALPLLAASGAAVVTQHGLIASRGDRYRADLPAARHAELYRGAGFLKAGLILGASSDAPYGPADPWRAMRAAVRRSTASGARLAPAEALTPEQALAGYLRPGALLDPPRRLNVGSRADLCVLSTPWAVARQELSAELVRDVFIDGVRCGP